jgi:hypothetical protein
MPVKVFDRLNSALTEGPRKPIKPWPNSIVQLLAAAGLTPGDQIPMEKLDATFAKLGLTIKQRLEAKASLRHYKVIAP